MLIKKNLKHIWHPCTKMKDFEQYPPIEVHRAQGSYLYTEQGPIIDAISSWWCKSLGHGHPHVLKAIHNQLDQFEHIIAATTTHSNLSALGELLAKISGLQHVFFASDGSSAVEIALKLSIQASQLKGYPKTRHRFVSLSNSYHGETLATLSISDLALYKKPYDSFSLNCDFIKNIPYVSNEQSPLWSNCEDIWPEILHALEKNKEDICAIIVEPIVQGASGMRIYSADFLKKLALFAKANDIAFIADEIMTGLGRTGKWLASEHAGIKPDLICLSKGLTSGTMPLSCVLIDHSIYELFYGNHEPEQTFLHSHTYSGHAVGVSAALATLNYMQKENINLISQNLGNHMTGCFNEIAATTQKLSNVRSIGAIVAGDLPEHENRNIELEFHKIALEKGAYLRLLGRTLYWLPPMNTDTATIDKLAQITYESIQALY